MGLILSNHTYLINPKCQIMNQESKLIKTQKLYMLLQISRRSF